MYWDRESLDQTGFIIKECEETMLKNTSYEKGDIFLGNCGVTRKGDFLKGAGHLMTFFILANFLSQLLLHQNCASSYFALKSWLLLHEYVT